MFNVHLGNIWSAQNVQGDMPNVNFYTRENKKNDYSWNIITLFLITVINIIL